MHRSKLYTLTNLQIYFFILMLFICIYEFTICWKVRRIIIQQLMRNYTVRESLTNTLSMQQSNQHQAAIQPGKLLSMQARCKCCGLPCAKQSLNFCFSAEDICHMGPGIPLYFRFLAIAVGIVLFPAGCYSIPLIIYNVQFQQYSQNLAYSQNWSFRLSSINSLNESKQLYSYILGGVALLLIIYCPLAIKLSLLILSKFYSVNNKYQFTQPISLLFKLEQPTNYSEWDVVRTINDWYKSEQKIYKNRHKNYPKIQKNDFNKQVEIVQKVYFHFNIELYEEILKEIKDLQEAKVKQQHDEDPVHSIQASMKQQSSMRSLSSRRSSKSLLIKINKIEGLKEKIRKKELQKTNKFIVVFKSYEYCNYVRNNQVIRLCKSKSNSIKFPGDNHATVVEAPFPNQVDYKAQSLDYFTYKIKYRWLSWLINFIVIAIGTALQFIVLLIISKLNIPQSILQYSSIIIAFTFYLISQIGCKIATIFTNKESHPNLNQKQVSIFLHILVTNLFLKCISVISMYIASDIKIYQYQGLIETATWLLILTTGFLTINRLLNYKIIRYAYHMYTSSTFLQSCKDQTTFNKFLERPENNLHEQYAQICQVILISLVYVSIIPISTLISFAYILVSFFLQRICFIRIYKEPHPTSDYLFLLFSTLLWKLIPVSIAGGHFYLIYTMFMSIKTINLTVIIMFLIILGLNLIIIFIPSFLLKPNISQNLTYQQITQNLIFCYTQYNPLYQASKLQSHEHLKQKTKIYAVKSDILAQQLNTMSRSLQQTLREKLFNLKNPILQALGNNDEHSQVYFQFDQKVEMPKKQVLNKKLKHRVPPIFKQSMDDARYRRRTEHKKQGQELVKLNSLVSFEQQQQGQKLKNKIKQAILKQINKIQ